MWWNSVLRVLGYVFILCVVVVLGFWSWAWFYPNKPLQFTKGAPVEQTITDEQGLKIPLLPDGTPAFNYGEKSVDVKPPAEKEEPFKVTRTKDKDGVSKINFSAELSQGRSLSGSFATDDSVNCVKKGDEKSEVKAEATTESWKGRTLQRKTSTKSSSIRKAEVVRPKPVRVATVVKSVPAAVSVAPVAVQQNSVASPCKEDCDGDVFILPAPRDQNR